MNPDYKDFNKISSEQRIHDLAITYALYAAIKRSEHTDAEGFYQDYESFFGDFTRLVEHYR